MDYSLRDAENYELYTINFVLILILMDYSLRL